MAAHADGFRAAPQWRHDRDRRRASRFARCAESGLHLRTHGDPIDLRSEHIDEPGIPFVAPVVSHRLTEQTGGDTDTWPIAHDMILSMPRKKAARLIGQRFEAFSSVV